MALKRKEKSLNLMELIVWGIWILPLDTMFCEWTNKILVSIICKWRFHFRKLRGWSKPTTIDKYLTISWKMIQKPHSSNVNVLIGTIWGVFIAFYYGEKFASIIIQQVVGNVFQYYSNSYVDDKPSTIIQIITKMFWNLLTWIC